MIKPKQYMYTGSFFITFCVPHTDDEIYPLHLPSSGREIISLKSCMHGRINAYYVIDNILQKILPTNCQPASLQQRLLLLCKFILHLLQKKFLLYFFLNTLLCNWPSKVIKSATISGNYSQDPDYDYWTTGIYIGIYIQM